MSTLHCNKYIISRFYISAQSDVLSNMKTIKVLSRTTGYALLAQTFQATVYNCYYTGVGSEGAVYHFLIGLKVLSAEIRE